MENNNSQSLLTSNEVAKLLGVNTSSVINWTKKGYIRGYKTPGGHRRYLMAEVQQFADAQKMPLFNTTLD